MTLHTVHALALRTTNLLPHQLTTLFSFATFTPPPTLICHHTTPARGHRGSLHQHLWTASTSVLSDIHLAPAAATPGSWNDVPFRST